MKFIAFVYSRYFNSLNPTEYTGEVAICAIELSDFTACSCIARESRSKDEDNDYRLEFSLGRSGEVKDKCVCR